MAIEDVLNRIATGGWARHYKKANPQVDGNPPREGPTTPATVDSDVQRTLGSADAPLEEIKDAKV